MKGPRGHRPRVLLAGGWGPLPAAHDWAMSYGLGCGPWSSSAPVHGGLRAARARTIGFNPSLGFLGRGPRGGDRPPRRPLLLLLLLSAVRRGAARARRCRARAAYRPTSIGPPCTNPGHRELRGHRHSCGSYSVSSPRADSL